MTLSGKQHSYYLQHCPETLCSSRP